MIFSYTNWLNWIEFDRCRFTHKLRIVRFIVSLWMYSYEVPSMDDDLTFSYCMLISIHLIFFSLSLYSRRARLLFLVYLYVYNMDSFPLFHSSFRFGAFSNLLSFHNCERVSFTQTSFKRIASYLNTRKLFFFSF